VSAGLNPAPEAWPAPHQLELRLAQAEAEMFLLREQLRRARSGAEDLHHWMGRVLEALPVGLVWSDPDGRVRSMNVAAEEQLGVRRGEARGRTYGELWPGHPSPADRLRSGMSRCLALEGAPRAGQPVHLDSEVRWVRGARGVTLGAVELLTDRTEAQQLRQELESSRALAALGRVAAVAAHEIRNPLGGISGFLDLLERGLAPDDPRLGYAAKMRGGIAALEKLVAEFLEFTRPCAPRREPVELGGVVDGALAGVAPLARERSVELRWRRPRLAWVDGDGERLHAAVANLVRNAVQASPAGGRVTVLLAPGREHRLTVSDQGPGVDPKLRERMFEPFVTGKARGTGLGLALAARAAEAHGGTLGYRDRQPHGARFELRLPARAADPQEEGR